MTAIIVSILAALGIGGGVMLASSGGGSSSGGAAVVAPVNPGGNSGGSSSGGSTGGSSGGTSSGGATGSSNVGALLAKGSLNGVNIVGKAAQGNTTLNGKNLTIGISPYAPILVNGTTYKTNEEYDTMATSNGEHKIISGYTADSPIMTETINLTTIDASIGFADFYAGPGYRVKNLGTLNTSYLKNKNAVLNKTFTDVTWTFNIYDFALGARNLGLQNSEFGYYTWHSVYSSTDINANSSLRDKIFNNYGAQQFYMFDRSKQITNYSKYGQAVTFKGNVIGTQHFENYVCRTDNISTHITGNISLSLNLANNTLTGSINNVKLYTYSHSGSSSGVFHPILSSSNTGTDWYNLTLSGNINTVNASSPNITFTNVTYDPNQTIGGKHYDGYALHPLNNSDNFGDAVIVKSNTSKDEMVGQISFTGHDPQTSVYYFYDTYLAFGAKQQ